MSRCEVGLIINKLGGKFGLDFASKRKKELLRRARSMIKVRYIVVHVHEVKG